MQNRRTKSLNIVEIESSSSSLDCAQTEPENYPDFDSGAICLWCENGQYDEIDYIEELMSDETRKLAEQAGLLFRNRFNDAECGSCPSEDVQFGLSDIIHYMFHDQEFYNFLKGLQTSKSNGVKTQSDTNNKDFLSQNGQNISFLLKDIEKNKKNRQEKMKESLKSDLKMKNDSDSDYIDWYKNTVDTAITNKINSAYNTNVNHEYSLRDSKQPVSKEKHSRSIFLQNLTGIKTVDSPDLGIDSSLKKDDPSFYYTADSHKKKSSNEFFTAEQEKKSIGNEIESILNSPKKINKNQLKNEIRDLFGAEKIKCENSLSRNRNAHLKKNKTRNMQDGEDHSEIQKEIMSILNAENLTQMDRESLLNDYCLKIKEIKTPKQKVTVIDAQRNQPNCKNASDLIGLIPEIFDQRTLSRDYCRFSERRNKYLKKLLKHNNETILSQNQKAITKCVDQNKSDCLTRPIHDFHDKTDNSYQLDDLLKNYMREKDDFETNEIISMYETGFKSSYLQDKKPSKDSLDEAISNFEKIHKKLEGLNLEDETNPKSLKKHENLNMSSFNMNCVCECAVCMCNNKKISEKIKKMSKDETKSKNSQIVNGDKNVENLEVEKTHDSGFHGLEHNSPILSNHTNLKSKEICNDRKNSKKIFDREISKFEMLFGNKTKNSVQRAISEIENSAAKNQIDSNNLKSSDLNSIYDKDSMMTKKTHSDRKNETQGKSISNKYELLFDKNSEIDRKNEIDLSSELKQFIDPIPVYENPSCLENKNQGVQMQPNNSHINKDVVSRHNIYPNECIKNDNIMQNGEINCIDDLYTVKGSKTLPLSSAARRIIQKLNRSPLDPECDEIYKKSAEIHDNTQNRDFNNVETLKNNKNDIDLKNKKSDIILDMKPSSLHPDIESLFEDAGNCHVLDMEKLSSKSANYANKNLLIDELEMLQVKQILKNNLNTCQNIGSKKDTKQDRRKKDENMMFPLIQSPNKDPHFFRYSKLLSNYSKNDEENSFYLKDQDGRDLYARFDENMNNRSLSNDAIDNICNESTNNDQNCTKSEHHINNLHPMARKGKFFKNIDKGIVYCKIIDGKIPNNPIKDGNILVVQNLEDLHKNENLLISEKTSYKSDGFTTQVFEFSDNSSKKTFGDFNLFAEKQILESNNGTRRADSFENEAKALIFARKSPVDTLNGSELVQKNSENLKELDILLHNDEIKLITKNKSLSDQDSYIELSSDNTIIDKKKLENIINNKKIIKINKFYISNTKKPDVLRESVIDHVEISRDKPLSMREKKLSTHKFTTKPSPTIYTQDAEEILKMAHKRLQNVLKVSPENGPRPFKRMQRYVIDSERKPRSIEDTNTLTEMQRDHLHGIMKKKGYGSFWKTNWFQLKENTLICYNNKKMKIKNEKIGEGEYKLSMLDPENIEYYLTPKQVIDLKTCKIALVCETEVPSNENSNNIFSIFKRNLVKSTEKETIFLHENTVINANDFGKDYEITIKTDKREYRTLYVQHLEVCFIKDNEVILTIRFIDPISFLKWLICFDLRTGKIPWPA